MSHRNFLIDLINGLDQAGFTDMQVSDEDLGVVCFDEVGAEKMADEILSLDDVLYLTLKKEDVGRGTLVLYCGNDPWETVMDLGFSSEEMGKPVDELLDLIEDKYTP